MNKTLSLLICSTVVSCSSLPLKDSVIQSNNTVQCSKIKDTAKALGLSEGNLDLILSKREHEEDFSFNLSSEAWDNRAIQQAYYRITNISNLELHDMTSEQKDETSLGSSELNGQFIGSLAIGKNIFCDNRFAEIPYKYYRPGNKWYDDNKQHYFILKNNYSKSNDAFTDVTEIVNQVKNFQQTLESGLQRKDVFYEADLDKVFTVADTIHYPEFNDDTREVAADKRKNILINKMKDFFSVVKLNIGVNAVLTDVVANYVPNGITNQQASSIEARVAQLYSDSALADERDLDVKKFSSIEAYADDDFKKLLKKSVSDRSQVFFAFVLANSKIEFNRENPQSVRVFLRIDFPKVITEYKQKKIVEM